MNQGEGVEGADRKEDPLDFALWKAQKDGRGHRLGRALGPRAAGLAHRVLGDGRGAARRRLRDPRRRQRPRLPPPRERGGADALRPRRRARADLDAQRDAPVRRGEDGQERRQRRAAARGARRVRPRRADHALLSAPTTASRWQFDDAPDGRRGARRARARRRRAGSSPGPSPAGPAPLREALLRRAGRGLQHAGGAGGAVRLDQRAPTGARPEPVGDADLARCSPCWASRTCSTQAARRAREELELLERAARRPARRGTSPRPTACATSCAQPRLGGAATGRDRAAELVRDRAVILYGRNPVREALRAGRRPMHRGLGDRAAPRASPGCATCRLEVVDAAEEIARRARHATTTRASAPRPAPTRTPTRRAARRARTRCIVALDELQDPQNLGAICRTRRVRGRHAASSSAERRAADGHAGGGQGLGRRGRAPARSRACATSPTSSARPRRPAAGATAPRRAATVALRRARLHAAASCSSWEPRAAGCARAWRAPATRSSRCRCAAAIESLNVSAAAAVLLYEILQRREHA